MDGRQEPHQPQYWPANAGGDPQYDGQMRMPKSTARPTPPGSSLSANAPVFVPKSAIGSIQQPHPQYDDWQQQQQPRFAQPAQHPYTPYTPQQPMNALQHQMATLSFSSGGGGGHTGRPFHHHADRGGGGGNVQNRLHYRNGPMPHASGAGGGGIPAAYSSNHHYVAAAAPQVQHHMAAQQQHQQHHHHQADLYDAGGGGNGDGVVAAAAAEQSYVPNETEKVALNFLMEVIGKLEDNPGMFETYQKRMKEMFFELASNNFVMSNALELLFTQSIKSQNFRYMGARICNLLDDLDPSTHSLFRNLLHLKMNFEKEELKNYIFNDTGTVRGTTLFLAELYMQLRRPQEPHRNGEIAHSIISSVDLLLSKPGPENLKCVCQTLKLCGFELEVDSPHRMDGIMGALEPYKTTTDTSTSRLIQSVLDLRSNRWGRTEAAFSYQQPDMNNTPYHDGPVFYGPDGQVLTEEENSFLSSNVPSYPNLSYDDLVDDEDSDELVDDENEVDLEIQMAFKEFVKGNKAASKANK